MRKTPPWKKVTGKKVAGPRIPDTEHRFNGLAMLDQQPTTSNRQSKGFTLIELLVVVAIIAVLISILVPSLKRAQDLARSVVCQGNEHAIGVSFMIYQNEYDGWMPRSQDLSGGTDYSTFDWNNHLPGEAPKFWADDLIEGGYIVKDAFDCPGMPLERNIWVAMSANCSDFGIAGTLLDNNGNLWQHNQQAFVQYGPWPLRLITRQQEGMLLSESIAWAGTNIRPWMGSSGDKVPHNDRRSVNILFYDVHVEPWDVYARCLYDNTDAFVESCNSTAYHVYTQHPWDPQWSPGGKGPYPIWRPWDPYWP